MLRGAVINQARDPYGFGFPWVYAVSPSQDAYERKEVILTNEEDAYNAMFAYLMEKNIRCPACDAGPTEVGPMGPVGDEKAYALCSNPQGQHMFVVNLEVDDDLFD